MAEMDRGGGRIVGLMDTVRGRARCGGTGVEIVESGKANVAVGAGVWRRGGDAAGKTVRGVVGRGEGRTMPWRAGLVVLMIVAAVSGRGAGRGAQAVEGIVERVVNAREGRQTTAFEQNAG